MFTNTMIRDMSIIAIEMSYINYSKLLGEISSPAIESIFNPSKIWENIKTFFRNLILAIKEFLRLLFVNKYNVFHEIAFKLLKELCTNTQNKWMPFVAKLKDTTSTSSADLYNLASTFDDVSEEILSIADDTEIRIVKIVSETHHDKKYYKSISKSEISFIDNYILMLNKISNDIESYSLIRDDIKISQHIIVLASAFVKFSNKFVNKILLCQKATNWSSFKNGIDIDLSMDDFVIDYSPNF